LGISPIKGRPPREVIIPIIRSDFPELLIGSQKILEGLKD